MRNIVRYKSSINNISVTIFFNKHLSHFFVFFYVLSISLGNLTKLPAMVLCLGEPPEGFCDVGCCCSFSSISSEVYPGYFWLLYFCQVFSSQFYSERCDFEWAFFNRRCFFTLCSFIDIFGTFL